MERSARDGSWRPGPVLVSLVVGGAAAVLVLYPIFYLIQASLSVGDPQARPPEAYGLDNYLGLPRYAHIFWNTVLVAVIATAFAIVLGFAMAIQNCELFEVLLPAGAQKYGLAQDIDIDGHGLVHAFNGPGLGAAIDFDLIERKKIAVLS